MTFVVKFRKEMANIAKESVVEKERITPTSAPQKSEVDEIWKQANREIEQNNRDFEAQIIACPQDGTNSKFIRYEGSYTRVRGMFRCQNGHEFFEG